MGTLEYLARFTMHDLRDDVSLSNKCNTQAAEVESSLQLSSPAATAAGTAHSLKLPSQSKSCTAFLS